MKSTNLEKKKFGGKVHRDLSGLALLLCMAVCIVGIVIAYFFSDDFSSNNVNMSGRVEIIAVGNGPEYPSTEHPATYPEIEDTTTSNLIIKLEDNYDVLIPGMEIEAFANVKVMYSTTKPLLRAKFELELTDQATEDTNEDGVVDEKDRVIINTELSSELAKNIRDQFNTTIIADNDWLKFSDGYFYYIGDNIEDDTDPKFTQLKEVDATVNDRIIFFLDKPFIFPTFVISDYSSLGVKIIVTFEAIQNFIPDENGIEYFHEKDNGDKVNNTIEFSKYIFDDIRDPATSTDTRHNVILTIDGVSTQYAFTPGITLAEALTNEGITITDSNSCGWFSDYGMTEPVLTTDTISNGMYLYTRTATPEKLKFTSSGSNYHVSALNTSITGDVVIPRVYNGGLVTEVLASGFAGCKDIVGVTISATISTLGATVFSECSQVAFVNLPTGIVSVGSACFGGLVNVKKIIFPRTLVNYIHGSYFSPQSIGIDSRNTKYHVSNNCLIETATKTLVQGCSLSVIPTDGSVTSLVGGCFMQVPNLSTLFIPKTITSIGTAIIAYTEVVEILVDKNNPVYQSSNNCIIETASKTLIVGCNASRISNDGSITSIGDAAFYGMPLIKHILIPKTVISIGSYAFYRCSELSSVFIPSSVQLISNAEKKIFYDCMNVKIYTNALEQPTGWGSNFNAIDKNYTKFASIYYGITLQQYLVTTGQSK